MKNLLDILVKPAGSFTGEFLINLLWAIVVFLIGLFIANFVKRIIVRVLKKVNLESLFKSKGLGEFWENKEIKETIVSILGGIVKWLIILVFTTASANILGLTAVSAVLNRILNYLPNMVSSFLILIIGVIIAGLVEKLVKGMLSSFDGRTGRLFGKVASYTVMVFTFMAILTELGIAELLINVMFIGFVFMISLGLGLAIGLGGKDLVSDILAEGYKKLKKK